MKTFDLEKYGTTYKIELKITSYMEGNLAVTMTSWENGEPEPWNVLTVNLDSVRPQNCAFIDTNNNGEEILAWIIRHGLAVFRPGKSSSRSPESPALCLPPAVPVLQEYAAESFSPNRRARRPL